MLSKNVLQESNVISHVWKCLQNYRFVKELQCPICPSIPACSLGSVFYQRVRRNEFLAPLTQHISLCISPFVVHFIRHLLLQLQSSDSLITLLSSENNARCIAWTLRSSNTEIFIRISSGWNISESSQESLNYSDIMIAELSYSTVSHVLDSWERLRAKPNWDETVGLQFFQK